MIHNTTNTSKRHQQLDAEFSRLTDSLTPKDWRDLRVGNYFEFTLTERIEAVKKYLKLKHENDFTYSVDMDKATLKANKQISEYLFEVNNEFTRLENEALIYGEILPKTYNWLKHSSIAIANGFLIAIFNEDDDARQWFIHSDIPLGHSEHMFELGLITEGLKELIDKFTTVRENNPEK